MCLHLFKYETEHVKDMLLLAAGFEDGSISMFNAMNGEELVQCIVHTAPGNLILFFKITPGDA